MITLSYHILEDIIPNIGLGKPKLKLGNYFIKASSSRLECFRRNRSCVKCKRIGNIFLVQCTLKDFRYNISPHLNLYHYDHVVDELVLMTQDHIVPKSRGGKDRIENLQTMCYNCNNLKGNCYDP